MAASQETSNQDMIGRKVECRAAHGAFKPCQWCGCKEGTLADGGVHSFGISCSQCHRRGRWVSRAEAAHILDRVITDPDVEVSIMLPADIHRTFEHIAATEDTTFDDAIIEYLKAGL
jgi:hypothetical protein